MSGNGTRHRKDRPSVKAALALRNVRWTSTPLKRLAERLDPEGKNKRIQDAVIEDRTERRAQVEREMQTEEERFMARFKAGGDAKVSR